MSDHAESRFLEGTPSNEESRFDLLRARQVEYSEHFDENEVSAEVEAAIQEVRASSSNRLSDTAT